MKRLILAAAIACWTQPAAAGEFSYFCSVQNVYDLQADATLAHSTAHTKIMQNQVFSVDRQTGAITGERIPAFRPLKHAVLYPGNSGNSFKSYIQGANFVSYLEVYEYKDGKRKPFVLHDSIFVYTGLCE